MEGVGYAMHITIEGKDNIEVENSLKRVKEIAELNNGKEITNSLPKLVRANPFLPLNRLLDQKREMGANPCYFTPFKNKKYTKRN